MAELSLADRGLTSIPVEVISEHAKTVTTVNLSENNLRDPSGLSHFEACETLILDKNELDNLEGFPRMPSVTTLWFNNNNMSDICEFMDQVVALFPRLVYLSAMRNPAGPPLVLMGEEDVAKSKRYRLYVIYRLPALQFLDASPVTAEERAEAKLTGEFLAVRKPKRATVTATAGATGTAGSTETSIFFAGDSSAVSVASDGKKGSVMLGLAPAKYDGRHSEGNRFIVDRDL